MGFEQQVMCPVHGTPMSKGNQSGVTIDACRAGCVFLDAGELATLMNLAATGQRLQFRGQRHGHGAHHGHHRGSGSFEVFGSDGFFGFGGGSGS